MSTHLSTITSPGTAIAIFPQNNPALEALQTYKQRDLSKGTRSCLKHQPNSWRPHPRFLISCCLTISCGIHAISSVEALYLAAVCFQPVPGNQSGTYLTIDTVERESEMLLLCRKETLTEGGKFDHEPPQLEGVTDLCETPLSNPNEFIIGHYYVVPVRDLQDQSCCIPDCGISKDHERRGRQYLQE